MYISEITIDGFKSYASRVTLTNFDQCFNAITGLNGTGKSNILDSICFVLGLKNLSQVRATSLTDLVYKQGQAGITKATVSVTFHNDDPKKAPAQYEDKEYITVTRQVVIGGRNKYLINGHVAQEHRVADLFQSVQLNVNNPTFLIMQGRITKVLNMKPPEILALLEEASGTKMFEKKKEISQKTLEKKEAKLAEIDKVMSDDILPALVKLREQCKEYNEFNALISTRDRLRKFCIAYEYTDCMRFTEAGSAEVQALGEAIKGKQADKQAIQAELDELVSQVNDLLTEKEIQAGGEIKELSKEVDSLQMSLTKGNAALKNKKASLASEQASLAQLKASLAELAGQDHEAAVISATEARDAAKAALDAAEQGVEAASRELAGAEAGDGRDESNRSLQERLADAQNQQTAADAEAKQADVASKHLAKQLGEAQKALAAKEREGGSLAQEVAGLNAAVQTCSQRLEGLCFDQAEVSELERQRDTAADAVRRGKEEVDSLGRDVAGVKFSYSLPRRDFDTRKVHGVVAELVTLAEPSAALALEVAAGGKLFNVVVDDDLTAKELLEKGQLKRRVTLIPLNKVSSHTLSASQVEAAMRLGGGKARPALELLQYAPHLTPAMQFVFGNVLICQDSGTAKKLAFSREVHCRCVTLEGDDFNPSGLLSGGSRASGPALLSRLSTLAQAEARLAQARSAQAAAEARLGQLAEAANTHKKLQRELELARHQLGLAQARQSAGEAAQLAASVAELGQQLQDSKAKAAEAAQKKADLVALAKDLERQIRDFEKDRGSRLKAAQDKLKKAKAAVEAARKAHRAAEVALTTALAERDAAGGERQQLEQQAAALQTTINGIEAEVAELSGVVDKAKTEHDAAATRLKALQGRLSECDAEISRLEGERDKLGRKADALEGELRKMEAKQRQRAASVSDQVRRRAELEADYSWIAAEKRSFGTGDYDFKAHDPQKMAAEYEAAEQRLGSLKGRVKPGVLTKLEMSEEQYHSLAKKREIVQQDKAKLQKVIGELEEQSRRSVEDVWRRVNASFGAIFSTLLPGAGAKLEPPEGGTYMDGLEVRVCFGSVWKESLTELSGGQRSLLALSLILALCRFKPAPIYILDEVDAALDLNHTQNIGRMIKEHFPESQFLVVSLKEGMFNNANVIFRTKFVDGVSSVTRTANERRNENDPGHAGPSAAGGGNKTSAAARNRAALRSVN